MNKSKIYLSILAAFFCLFAYMPVFAQTIPQNMSNLNVDDYSDTQIRQKIQQAQAAGMSDAQLIQTAQSNGMSEAQIQRFQSRINDIRRKDGDVNMSGNGSDTSASQSTRELNYRPDTSADKFRKKSRIFGANLFRNSTSKTFEPNLNIATPRNYIVGPGDQLHINVYGNSVANWNLNVSPEGNINIPGVGVINVAGKTVERGTAIITSRLIASNYAIGRGTNVAISLGNIRSIKVILQGELVKPGTYTLPSLSTVFNALYAASGPNDIGSFRKIEVIRNNRIVSRMDLYDFLVKGSTKDNVTLQDQDIIRVPTYNIRVDLNGEVKIPGLFETLPGETLQDVINFGGGFTDRAYTAHIKVIQVRDREQAITDVFENDFKNYTPLRGDRYMVDKILDRFENRITIKGAVFMPGEFELQKGLTLSKLIKNAGGLKEDAFTGRGSILRLKSNNITEQVSFNLAEVLNKPEADIPLQREDIITISSVFDLRDQYKVSIKGEVRKPGDFIYADSMKVADLIVIAGGFSEGASTKRIEVSRRVFNSDPSMRNSTVAEIFNINLDASLKGGDINFTLKPFDIVSIYSQPGYETQKIVKVEGEVIYPGNYAIKKKDEKISDIIARAGGLTASADVEGGSLKRDNTAVLGVDKTQVDTVALNKERSDRVKLLQHSYDGSLNGDSTQFRNNYIGIDLGKILKKPGTSDDLILENGDVLRVPKQQQTVRVNGEVLYPSAVVYNNGKTFRAYVLNAGGYSPNSLKRAAYIVYPNGTVKATTKFLFFNSHPRVKPGSEIYVPKKPAPKGNAIQNILGFTTGLASLGAIILGIISVNK